MSDEETIPVLGDEVPVVMPDLPPQLSIHTAQQYKALGDETRTRILGIIQQQPATAKQIADRLKLAPGTVGHHLQALEAAGLAQVVARRLVRGIVAKYYTRTARLFIFERPDEGGDAGHFIGMDLVRQMRDEVEESVADGNADAVIRTGLPHARITRARALEYERRLAELIDAFVQEPAAPDGVVFGLGFALYEAPRYLQVSPQTEGKEQP